LIREDHYAAWAWLILTAAVVVFVAGFDLWARAHGYRTMTAQFRAWLFDQVTGPFIFAGFTGTFLGLAWHFLVRGRQ